MAPLAASAARGCCRGAGAVDGAAALPPQPTSIGKAMINERATSGIEECLGSVVQRYSR
jgi:hypothetical protein